MTGRDDESYETWTRLADREATGEPLTDQEREVLIAGPSQEPRAAREAEVWAAFASLPQGEGLEEDEEDEDAVRQLVEAALAGVDSEDDVDLATPVESEIAPAANQKSKIVVIAAAAAGLFALAGTLVVLQAAKTDAPAPMLARAELAFVSGEVEINGSPAHSGIGLLAVGDAVSVGEGGACVAIDPGIDVCVGPNTKFSIGQLDAQVRELRVESGTMIADLEPQPPGSQFRITSPHGTSTAVGTVFAVEVDGGGASTTVLEGKVEVRHGESSAAVGLHGRARTQGIGLTTEVVDRKEEARLFALLAPVDLWKSTDPGSLVVRSTQARATVMLDGRALGPAPIATLLPAGDHEVVVEARGYAAATRAVEIDPGASETLDVALQLPSSVPEVEPADSGDDEGEREVEEQAPTKAEGPPPSAEALLSEARKSMAANQWKAAAVAYNRLVETHPKSAQAHAALVTLGDLRLDRLHKARGALRSYDAYLRRGGPMEQEARFGRARAWRALGNAGKERVAIEDFLSRYPGSLESSDLERRLKKLEQEEK